MKTLTNEQLGYLFTSVSRRHVKDYDVQLELVDHLASRVEELLTDNPSMMFEVAVGTAYADFGNMSFMGFAQNKKALALKSGRERWFKTLLGLFRWPELLLVSGIVIVTYVMYSVLRWQYFVLSNYALVSASLVYLSSKANNRFPLASMMFSSRVLGTIITVSLFMQILVPKFETWFTAHPAFPICLYSTGWIFLLAFGKVHLKMIKELKTQYPHAFA